MGEDHDTAYFARIQVGDYKKLWQPCFRYSYYSSEPDALFFAWPQSDTNRQSNVEAHRVDFRLGGPKKSYVNVTYYRTEPNFGEDTVLNRWQVDYIIRF
jgi:hypothetical protein